jgi:AraC-like DNA-binding protein
VAHLFVAPEGQVGRELTRALFATGSIVTLPSAALGELPAHLCQTFVDPAHHDDDLRALGRALATRLAGGDRRETVRDPRIERMVAWIASRLDDDLSLDEIAASVRLSPGRTRHLFVQETGLPFRTFVLWLRLTRALELFAGGTSLTDAAHGAGFADSAHLSRTFRRMFGIAAGSLQLG